MDVDYFKRYNDSLGHLAGDDCLAAIARVLIASLRRPADLAARYGGEEFVVLLPETEADGAMDVAQRILQALAQGRARLLPDRTSRLAWWARKFAPGFYARSMKRRVGAEFQQP